MSLWASPMALVVALKFCADDFELTPVNLVKSSLLNRPALASSYKNL